ncbi:hypothetical protein BpsM61_00062 [Bacillus phage vB_BpsM-61]|nr:hypothetical protein BpsM61_00062 [Bacillus phage vB_BpsM-61]
MAEQKALFTSQGDFMQKGIRSMAVDPFVFLDADGNDYYYDDVRDENMPMTTVGSPGVVDGVKGKALRYIDSYKWFEKNIPTRRERNIVSFWYKPEQTDLTGWRIFFSNRGWGVGDYGIHLAMLDGRMNARVHGSAGQHNILLPVDTTNRFEVGRTYQIIFKYDDEDTFPIQVFVNGGSGWETWIQNATAVDLGSYTRRMTIGAMVTGTGAYASGVFPLNGWMDEFMWFNASFNDDMPTLDQLRTTYRNGILNGDYIDWFSRPGAMTVGKSYNTGEYNQTAQRWESNIIALDPSDPFQDFARVQLNYEQPGGTTVNVYTRTSTDGSTWNDWVRIQNNGMVNSPENPFMQIRVDFFTQRGDRTPEILEVQLLVYPPMERLTLTSEPLIIYKDLESGVERVGELNNAYDIYITEEVEGEETLEFKMAINDPKRIALGSEAVEMLAEIGNKRFILRNPVDRRDNQGKKYTEFFAESLWYELRDFKVPEFEEVEKTAYDMVQAILDQSIIPTGWKIHRIEGIRRRTIRQEWKSVLALLREVADRYDMELIFDTVNRTISLVESIGEDNGVRFFYNKNLKSIERSVDTFNLVTRLYVEGRNGMTIRSVNDNVEYLENTKWVDALNLRNKIRIDRWVDGRYTVPQNLKDDGQRMLDRAAEPNVGYVMDVTDLSTLSGHYHESIGLGDTVHVVDTELLDLVVEARILKRKYNVREPHRTVVELNQKRKELSDANQRNIDDAVELLSQTDPLDTSDIQQMTVFNHLLNSRAEDGEKYWELTGSDIENEIGGFSGDASWKITGGYGSTNIMKQSIYGVSHRSAYTVSAYVGNDGTITRGESDDAFVGIRVRIHYTEPDRNGNTYEDHYLAIPDITQEGDDEGDEIDG